MGKLNTYIVSLLLCFSTLCAATSDSRWYQGCFQDLSIGRQDAPDGDNLDSWASQSGNENVTDQNKCPVVECCRKCFLQRFEFAALQSEDLCRCHRNQDDLRILSDELCLSGNRTEQDYLPLPCGLMNVSWSVFRSSGPYIVNISVTMDTPWVVTGRPVVIEVVTDLASFVNISDEVSSLLDPFEMLMEWSFDDVTEPGSLGLRAEGRKVYGRISHTFDTAGNNTFYVNVSNILSQAEIEVVVNVINPEPHDLEISLLQHISELPSCTPASWTSKGHPFIRVFMDEPFDIEASVAMGTNLTFGFEMDNETAIIVRPWDLDPPCRAWNCSAVYKKFVLSSPGRHSLRVSVHNQFGRLQKTWTIFVVRKYLDNPTFTMTTGSKDVVSPGEPIRFLVALEITARIGAILEVEFGDGEHHSTELKDTNSTSMALNSDHGPMMVVASYGQGCRLQVEFEHIYHRQGTYQPHLTVYNGNSTENTRQQNVSGKFLGYIQVINRLHGVRLESKHTVAAGQISKFQVELMSPSLNVSYNWSIMDEHDNYLSIINTSVNHIRYNFSDAGMYQVSVRAANIISEVQTATTIVVQESLADLQLTCSPRTCIRVDQLLRCSATVLHGSNPKFIWKIPNRHAILSSVKKQYDLSMANYTFDMPGRFNISVQAKNDVSDITRSVDNLICVQEPVTCVSIESYGPVLLGRPTEFEIAVAPMTFVMFKFESGPERHLWESVTVQQFLQDDGFYVAYEFGEAGIHDVTVTAYNNVSSASHSIKVLVMRAVPPLDVKVIGTAIVGKPTTLQIIPKWPYGVTDNLEYEWHIDNYTLYGTGSTIVTTTFSRPGYHQVNVTAANFVENRTKTLYVDVAEPSSVEWYLSHDIVIPVNQPLDFVLEGELMEGSMLHVEYDGPQYIKRLIDSTNNRWSQEFAEAGLYQTVVTMATEDAGSNNVDSLVLVQEKITGLELTGPQLIKIEILYKDYFWEAAIDSGTDVMYHWSLLSLSGGPNITGPSYGVLDKYRRQFEVPGIYNLVVAARNNVSQSQASLLITVSYPVTRVTVQTRPIPLGHTSYINITVTGADNFNVQVDFGDNTSTEVSTLQYNSNIFRLSEISFIVMTSHLYTSKGTFKVSVNVSNQVSSLEESGVVLVGEPITGIKLYTNSPALMQVAEWVVVTATVATGDDLTFEWDFSDEVYEPSQYLKVVSEGNNSTANYSFSMAGQYEVSVRVSNQLYTQPFIVPLDFKFHVMEVVSQLTIEIYEKITGSPLQGSAPNLSTPEVRFLSKCGGSDVTFEFNFGDGVTKQVSGILHQYVNIMMATSSHRYTKEGVYNVSVTARNSLSEMTSYLAMPFYVQLPTQGLQLHPEMIRTPFGEETVFRASVTGGTNFTFDWKFGDQSDIVNDAGPIVRHEYTQVGRYVVTVIAKNDVSQLTKTAEVQVLHRLQRVNLMLSKTIVATYEEVLYSAQTFPENADVSYFEWNFGVQEKPKQTYDPFKTHMYTIPSKYTVTVSAHNSISHVESEPVFIHVQSPVSEYLEIRYDPKKKHHIVYENSSFSVYHFSGNDLYYTWDFGDGTQNKTTKSKTMSHNYTSKGEYVIRVWAENLLSMTSASDNVFVLHEKCVKPELVIHGEFTKGERVSIHVLRSKELYVEVELKKIDCDFTNATAYRWTFYNATSGREVELDNLDDDVLRKKMLRIPARVLPYGTYDLKVTVTVRGTIVHTECQTKVSVDPTKPLCSMKGGVYREVSRDGDIVVDGTSSLDPDINSNSSLRFNWTCYVDYDPEKPCFKENLTDTVAMDTSRISFPGSWLREDRREFMMTLTLMTENRDDVKCSQMIHTSDLLELSIYCPQCKQSLVNWDWPLSFQAVCSNCNPLELEYEWTIYMVPDLGQSYVNHRYDKFSRTCAIAGQTHISKLVHGNKTLLFNVDSSRYKARVIPADTLRTDEAVSQGVAGTTTHKPLGLYYPIEDHSEGRSRGKDFSPPVIFQESRSTSGRQRGSDNKFEVADTPQIDDVPVNFDLANAPKTERRHSRRNIADNPQMESKHNVLDTADFPQMDQNHNTLDIEDFPQMDHNTLDMVDFPQMDPNHNTLDTADFPQMDRNHNTLDMADFPQMDPNHNTLDTADFPQMDRSHNTLDMADFPQMDRSHNTLDRADFPQMDRNTLDTADFPQMDHSHNTLDTADSPELEDDHDTLDTVDIPPPIEDFGLYNPIIEENTRVESSRRKPMPHTDMFELKEGSPGEEGSSIARNPAYDNDIFEDITSGNRPKPGVDDKENPTENEVDDEVISNVEGSHEPARQKHILQHAHYPIVLIWNNTLTGLNKRSLVLKPNNEAIQQGSTYIMHVRATTKDGSAQGHAMAQFKVNQSPHHGDCSVKPDSGFEMSTEFTIFCKEWRDVEEHLPLWYEVSYNLQEGDVRYVIYRGLRSSINFILPAGNPNNKHRVFVYITILDSLSGRTPVCHAPLTVRPQPPEQVRAISEAVPSPEETIFYEAFNGNGSIVKAKEQGYEHRVKVLVRYLATRLNQLPQFGTEVKEQRQEIRHKLLGILKPLPMRDELEVIQTLQALAALTEVASELNQAELDLASAVFRSILDRASELYSEALTPTHELLTLAVTTASNVISATVRSAARDKADKRWFYHTSMSASIHTLDQLLKNELKFHAIGQEPIKKQAYFVTTMASRFSLKDRPVLKIDQSKFTLPKDMSVIMKKDSCPLDIFSPNHDCFQVHMTKFLRNPYVFDHNKNTKVGSEVGALKIYTCDGESVQVSGLQDNNMVTMEIPRLPLKEEVTLSEHRLERALMNLHQFNVSKERQRQSLNIVFTLTPAYEERLFPIALMIRFQDPPTPDIYLLRREFDVTTLQGKLFLPASYFNVTGSYYLGVVDGGYNSGRHRPGEATQRNYTLKIWWANCLYWNETQSEWSDDGCWSTEESTYYVTHCRCNHLTAFGSNFDLVPNELSFVAVEDFFSHHENPITITLIGVILCLYAVLMVICHRADIHDAKKGGITYLQDNTITDQQRFEVTVETGFRKGAGTTAKISLILHGEEGMSETRELITDDRRPLFERNSRDKFILTLPDSIGKIWKVQIWHNNSGQSPSWYLSRVIVKDLNNGNIYYFLSEKWLAVEEEDGKVEREFMALEGSLGVRKVFWAKGTQYMADYHLWTSLFTHPSPSHFTRTQRLTCCLTLLMMYMCLNAIWYKRAPSEVRGEFGLLDLSLRNVTVGAMCCAVAIPVNLFLALLFRRSKKQRSTGEVDPELEEEKDKHYPSGKPDGVPQDDDEDSEAVQPVMTYSILDQSILNWPSIQDWAQKQWMKRQHSTMSIEETTSGKTNDNNIQQGQTTLTPTHILHKRVIGSETDQASSGFEDSNSTDPRPQMTISSQASSIKNKAPSVSSSVSQKSSVLSARKNFERRVFLPYWFQYVAWTLCAIICLGCAVVTVLYGFRFGQTKGMMWLQSLYFSAVVCIFISHPLMICIAVIYTAVKYRNNPSILDHYEDGYFGEQAKLEILRRKKEKAKETLDENKEIERGVAARQRSRYLRFARPPQEKQLIEARKKILKEKKAMSLVSNSVGFFVMLILLCVMAYGKDIVTSPFYLNEAIKNSLISSGVVKFGDISQPGDWYNWSQTTMLDTLYTDQGLQENNSKVVKRKFALHGSSFVIGQIHLRQMRVVKEPCVQKLPHLPEFCLHDYGYTNQMKDVSPDMNETWTENTAFFNIFGKHGVYDNSGFVIKLDNSRSKALSQLQQLEYHGWISKHTRAVVVELTLFNAPTNLFSSVALVMELSPTGGAFTDHRIMSTYLYRYMTPTDNFVLACELFFVILTLYKMKNEVCNLIKLRRNYLHSAWNIVQCLMVALSLTYIGCYLYRFILVWEALENMRSTYFEQFVDVSFLAVWDEILQVQVGVILFLVFIKSLRLLRYNKLFALFGNVYKRVHKELIIFTALFLGLLLAFSSLGLLLFGSYCWSFHDYWTTLFTLMSLMTGHYQHPVNEHTMSYFLRVFVFCFCVFFTGLLTSYVIAFLSFRFRVYRRKQSDILAMSGRDALLFYWNQFLMWTGIRYEPPVHEPENELPAEFTMVEIEYQVDELYFRINALSGLHSLPEKPTGYLTDSDGTYGVGDDGISSGGSEIQQGEEERLDHRVQQIEDYLYSQEPYLAQLLKMDNTDPDLLSQEKEKQLKSHLEMEIFRQLQIQRQDTDQPTSSKVKTGSSQGKKVDVDGIKGMTKDGGSDDQKKSVYSFSPPDESNSNESGDLDTQTSSSSNPESPRDHDKSGGKAVAEKQVRVSVGQTDKSGSQSSDSDKGLFTKGLKNEVKQKKPEPPPKPTFIKHNLRDVVSHDASRPVGSPALRQLRSSLNTIERLSFKGDNSGSSFTTESSSGSEQDAIHGMQRPHGKQRNLRKTKSRGKGKGSVNLTGSLLDELDTEDKEELEQYEFEFQNTEDQVEQETTSGQSDLANKTPCDKKPVDKEPITEQETVENKEEVERCSVKDSIKAFEKRAGNS